MTKRLSIKYEFRRSLSRDAVQRIGCQLIYFFIVMRIVIAATVGIIGSPHRGGD
jgi:hypothetical protein